MNNIKMAYIDSDGIAGNWRGYVLRNHFPGMTIEQLNSSKNMTKLLKRMYSKEQHLFYNIDPIPKFKLIIDALNSRGIEWKILTAIGVEHPHPKTAIRDKERFFSENFGIPPEKVITVRKSDEKVKFAKPNTLLIDDHKRNCDLWMSGGGGFVICPDTFTYDIGDVLRQIYEINSSN